MFFIRLIASFFFLFLATSAYAGPYYGKTDSAKRTDPRMKYFTSRQPNCARSGSRVCSTKVQADPFIHYGNTIREQEVARQKQIRPWL